MPDSEATLEITCREHGLIWSTKVHCHHDVERVMRCVGEAHSAPYGGGCSSMVDVAVTGAENKAEGWSRYPGVAPC